MLPRLPITFSGKRENLVTPMLTGDKDGMLSDAAAQDGWVIRGLALILLCGLCVAGVYYLVESVASEAFGSRIDGRLRIKQILMAFVFEVFVTSLARFGG